MQSVGFEGFDFLHRHLQSNGKGSDMKTLGLTGSP
jgi:hypothetical protein